MRSSTAPAVVVRFVQELVVALDNGSRFWRKAKMQIDRLSVLLDGRIPRLLNRARPTPKKEAAQIVDQAEQRPRYGLEVYGVELQDQTELAVESVVVRSRTNHLLDRRLKECNRHPVRIRIVAGSALRARGDESSNGTGTSNQTTLPVPVRLQPHAAARHSKSWMPRPVASSMR